MSIDRLNLEYEELLEIQERDLRVWAKLIRNEIYARVAHYVRRFNSEAKTPNDKHQVWRGQDLVEIILQWPAPEKSGYPPIAEQGVAPVKPGEAFI
jgi:hypothetical protein